MTVSEKHIKAAKGIMDDACMPMRFYENGVVRTMQKAISAALAAAEREGREDERKRCIRELRDELVEIYEDSPDIDVECNNLIRRVEGCILSQTNTHSVAPPPPGATEAGEAVPQALNEASPATNHASRNGRGEQ